MFHLLVSLTLILAEDDFDVGSSASTKVTHKLLHSYDGLSWEERGQIHLTSFSDKRRKPQISIKNLKFEKEKLKSANTYYIKVLSPNNSTFAQSSTPACKILGSDLQDIITLLYDQETDSIVAINYKTENNVCEKSTTALKLQTVGEVINTKAAIKPYFAPPKIEAQEERSFFSKYWWAIALGLFFFVSTAGAPAAQGNA